MVSCLFEYWTPGIGDKSVIGWLTVFVYLTAAVLAFSRARDAYSAIMPAPGALKNFWLVLAGLLLLLAINKQLDLQSAVTALGRCMADAQGWYDDRQRVQLFFVGAIAVIGALSFVTALYFLRRHLRQQWMVVAGLFLLASFVIMRASSFHLMDALINARILGVKINWIMELGALALVIAGIWRGKSHGNGH